MKITIVGYGRFGKSLHRLLKDDFSVYVYDPFVEITQKSVNVIKDIPTIYKSGVVFYAVPISKFENVLKEHAPFIKSNLLIDVLSVKLHAKDVFEKYIPKSATALLTHPMFGPDSSSEGFEDLPIVLDRFTADSKEYSYWKNYFNKKGLLVKEMTADNHDNLAANSQGVTHFIGRVIEEAKISSTEIDTTGAKKLQEVKKLTCNDTWQLFSDLQTYNPYTNSMRVKIGNAYEKVYKGLLPVKVDEGSTIFGIQGGLGSFNEQALSKYLTDNPIEDAVTKYLYTTERVLKNLHLGEIDYGLFAIHNSVGGMVHETIEAVSKYRFEIVKEFGIVISHNLMRRKDVSNGDLTTIMAHPQVLKQCKDTLKTTYSKYSLQDGEGDLIDTANAAKALSLGTLPNHTAILGPSVLAKIYNLEIIAIDLQDSKDNFTSFLLVKM